MQSVIFKNSKGQSIDFALQPPMVLQTINGVGEVETNTHTQKSPFQDGRTFIGSKFESREIFMQVAIVSREDKELFAYREKIQEIFNPKLGEGTLIYTNANGTYEIKGVVDGTPSFKYTVGVVTCQINLLCANPFWYSKDEEIYHFNAPYVPMFEFPFFSDRENEIEFGMEQETTTIVNEGTVYTPLIIEFDGGIKNATLTNETTGDYIAINKELLFGEVLTVDTSFGSRKIRLQKVDGTNENGFKYMTLDSKFLQLAEGENLIRYVAEADGNVTVRLKWHKRYLGL